MLDSKGHVRWQFDLTYDYSCHFLITLYGSAFQVMVQGTFMVYKTLRRTPLMLRSVLFVPYCHCSDRLLFVLKEVLGCMLVMSR